MFYIRPIAREDLPSILALSERTGAGLTTLPANRERLAARIERSLASFGGSASADEACFMFVLVAGASRGAGARGSRPRRRHQRHRGRGGTQGALVQLSRRHAGARVARARRVHGGAHAVPGQRSHRPQRIVLALPRPGLSTRQERRAAGEVSPPVHRGVRGATSRRRSSPSCAAGSTPTARARSGRAWAGTSSRWSIRRRIT